MSDENTDTYDVRGDSLEAFDDEEEEEEDDEGKEEGEEEEKILFISTSTFSFPYLFLSFPPLLFLIISFIFSPQVFLFHFLTSLLTSI